MLIFTQGCLFMSEDFLDEKTRELYVNTIYDNIDLLYGPFQQKPSLGTISNWRDVTLNNKYHRVMGLLEEQELAEKSVKQSEPFGLNIPETEVIDDEELAAYMLDTSEEKFNDWNGPKEDGDYYRKLRIALNRTNPNR